MKWMAIILSIILIILGNYASELLASDLVFNTSVFLIATFGILHGCSDLHLHQLNPTFKKVTFVTRLTIYLGMVSLLVLFYLIAPQICLVVFVLFSAYHFGEEQLESRFTEVFKWKGLLYFVFGNCILLLLFSFNSSATQEFLDQINIPNISKQTFIGFTVICTIAQFMMLLSLASLKIIKWMTLVAIELEMILICILFATTNLLIGFTTYFIFWHSLPSLKSQYLLIAKKYKSHNFRIIAVQSGSIYLIAVIFIFSIILSVENISIMVNLLLCLAIAITIPHIVTIAGMYRN